MGAMCCGLSFDSRGCQDANDAAQAQTIEALRAASDGGRRPIVCDTSPCASHLIKAAQSAAPELQIYEPVGFVERYLVDKLEWERTADPVAVHVPCSSTKLGLGPSFHRLAGKCAHDVVDSGVPCCAAGRPRPADHAHRTRSAPARASTSACGGECWARPRADRSRTTATRTSARSCLSAAAGQAVVVVAARGAARGRVPSRKPGARARPSAIAARARQRIFAGRSIYGTRPRQHHRRGWHVASGRVSRRRWDQRLTR